MTNLDKMLQKNLAFFNDLSLFTKYEFLIASERKEILDKLNIRIAVMLDLVDGNLY